MPAGDDVCIIFNPAAGKGQAGRRLARIRDCLGNRATWRPTLHPGHAIALAREAAQEGFAVVAAAGGDGTVHEVANGILEAGDPKVQFGILPIGSANDYVASLDHECAAEPAIQCKTVDVGLVRAPDGRHKHFVCCLGLGLNGAVTMESRKIRRLQGIFLYGLATIQALWRHYACPRMRFSFDGGPEEEMPTLMFSVLVGRREGGFVMAPNARMDDGYFDYLHVGNLSRWGVLRFLPQVALFGPPLGHPKVRHGQCKRLTVESEKPLVVHVDGEFFCVPSEGVTRLEMEILPGALTVARAW